VTIPDLPADRPIPDTDDLRLLAELINNAYIPLANAAWNARMSQAEAALRLVSMAERGLPLRLVADGDRQQLWHIAQSGPATSGVPLTSHQPAPATGAPPVPGPAEASMSGPQPPVAVQLTTAPPVPVVAPPGMPAPASSPTGAAATPGVPAPVLLPPASPVPPHEQAIAGAVPLGQPPFGQPEAPASGPVPAAEPAPDAPPVGSPAPDTAEPGGAPDAGSAWGPAGSSSWARVDEAPAVPAEPPAPPETAAPANPPSSASPVTPGPPRWEPQHVTGPGGEQLTVTVLAVLDPGDAVLTDAGYRMEPGQRAVLVHSSVQNAGQAHYYPVGDANLVLETDAHVLLGRANVAVATHPAFGVGVAPGRTADGWSVFLIPSETVLAGLKWCIRPDIPQTIVGWPIAP